MLRSLRFQLPALFLLGVVVAGLVSAAIALRLFRSYAESRARAQAYQEVAREADGLTQLYGQQAGLKLLSARRLELATGDKIFYQPRARGLDPFPGQGPAFTPLPKGVLNPNARFGDRGVTFVFRPRTRSCLLRPGRCRSGGRCSGRSSSPSPRRCSISAGLR
jgi:type II secretory pathway pseudopilin PulG